MVVEKYYFFGMNEGNEVRVNAQNERWMPMVIRGVAGYFSDARIDRKTVPKWLQFWEVADGDSDGIPCRYRKGILVNFYGTFITRGVLPIDCMEWQEGFIADDEWEFFRGKFYGIFRNGKSGVMQNEKRNVNIFGYARVSSTEQNLDRQIVALKEYVKPENIVVDKASGKNTDREGYQALKGVFGLREGDVLYITSIDRLSRNKEDIKRELEWFKRKESG